MIVLGLIWLFILYKWVVPISISIAFSLTGSDLGALLSSYSSAISAIVWLSTYIPFILVIRKKPRQLIDEVSS